MKLLKDILYKTTIKDVIGNTNTAIDKITFNSKEVSNLSLFIAIKGDAFDGHAYIQNAINQGATAIVCENLPENINKNITYIKTDNSRKALALIACNFHDNPSQKIKIIGVTGTNGKTSVTTLCHQLFTDLGLKSGLVSTVETRIHKTAIPSTHTTPDPITLNKLFNQMIAEDCTHCFMEVSSHAIHQHRIDGVEFSGGVFTNITHDHLDYHETFQNYLNCKKQFFDKLPATAFALYNKDDKNGKIMVQNTSAKRISYAIQSPADYQCRVLENSITGLHLSIKNQEVWLRLTGKFNAYNATAVYAVAELLNIEQQANLLSISNIKGAEGRFELIKNDENKIVVVDYAHTPDALKNVLETIHDIKTDSQKIITVIGCGGNRDVTKRPKLAKIASDYSNNVVLTSDNPRDEDPTEIINQMKKGVVNSKTTTLSIENRKEAINTALALATAKDIVLVAGKGHEKYQEIKGIKHPFDDVETIKNLLKK